MFENAILNGAIVGGATAAMIMIAMTLLRKPIKCPNCGQEQAKFRKPANTKQAMWGGFTCPKCGTEMDARGKVREAK